MYIKICAMYVKIVGREEDKIYVKNYSEYVQAIKELKKQNKPLTFAFELPEEHHCTISYINKCTHKDFYTESKNFFDVIENCTFTQFLVKKEETFNKTNVIILEIESQDIYNAYQRISQVGKKEGLSKIRVPHMSYYTDSSANKLSFVKSILSNI